MDKRHYVENALVLGLVCLFCSFYFFAPTLFTIESSLIKRKGKVESVNTFYSRVSSRGSKSTKAELKLTLENDFKTYRIMKNIGQQRLNPQFELIKKELINFENATILIKKSHLDNFIPTVFQIKNSNDEILYSIADAKYHSKFGFGITFFFGIVGMSFYSHYRIKKWKKNASA
jgi:hypothetical protein